MAKLSRPLDQPLRLLADLRAQVESILTPFDEFADADARLSLDQYDFAAVWELLHEDGRRHDDTDADGNKHEEEIRQFQLREMLAWYALERVVLITNNGARNIPPPLPLPGPSGIGGGMLRAELALLVGGPRTVCAPELRRFCEQYNQETRKDGDGGDVEMARTVEDEDLLLPTDGRDHAPVVVREDVPPIPGQSSRPEYLRALARDWWSAAFEGASLPDCTSGKGTVHDRSRTAHVRGARPPWTCDRGGSLTGHAHGGRAQQDGVPLPQCCGRAGGAELLEQPVVDAPRPMFYRGDDGEDGSSSSFDGSALRKWAQQRGHRFVSVEISRDGTIQSMLSLRQFLLDTGLLERQHSPRDSKRRRMNADDGKEEGTSRPRTDGNRDTSQHLTGKALDDVLDFGGSVYLALGKFYASAMNARRAVEQATHQTVELSPSKYLVEYPLLQQFPELAGQFREAVVGATATAVAPRTMAFLGPAGTVTSLHYDNYENYFQQVMGAKFFRLYPPSTPRWLLKPGDSCSSATNSGAATSPTCAAHFSSLRTLEDLPTAQTADSVDIILEAGDSLLIPPRWWHYVESLTPSFSLANMTSTAGDHDEE